MIEGKQ